MVSAYATKLGVSLGQEGTTGKGNELVAIKALLETLVLKGCIVTMDALGCQTDVAEKIVAQGGDYVLAVKDNQKNLSQAIVEFFTTAETLDFRNIDVEKRVWIDKDHGRLETRRAASGNYGLKVHCSVSLLWGKCDCPVQDLAATPRAAKPLYHRAWPQLRKKT